MVKLISTGRAKGLVVMLVVVGCSCGGRDAPVQSLFKSKEVVMALSITHVRSLVHPERQDWIELVTSEKPDATIRDALKASGFWFDGPRRLTWSGERAKFPTALLPLVVKGQKV